MGSYKLTWVIDMEADSPKEAAKAALQLQLENWDTTANVFEVEDKETGDCYNVDLMSNRTTKLKKS